MHSRVTGLYPNLLVCYPCLREQSMDKLTGATPPGGRSVTPGNASSSQDSWKRGNYCMKRIILGVKCYRKLPLKKPQVFTKSTTWRREMRIFVKTDEIELAFLDLKNDVV